jgi:hypothetical protein
MRQLMEILVAVKIKKKKKKKKNRGKIWGYYSAYVFGLINKRFFNGGNIKPPKPIFYTLYSY